MKNILKGIVPGLLLTALATTGFAENRQGSFNLSPFVGGYVLDDNQREQNRPIFGLRAGYNFTRNLGGEAMFGYSLTDTKPDFGSKETDLYRYGFDFLYHFMPDGNLVPFIAIGGGGTNFETPNSPSNPRHGAGLVDFGGGLKYFVSDSVALRGDVRDVVLVDDTGHNNLEYSVGLTFQFGGTKKAVIAKAVPAAAVAAVDTTPPTVSFTSPVNGATNVNANQQASVAFSEDMDPATLTGDTFTLKQGKTPLSGRVATVGSNASFTPASNLEKGKVYTATVTTGAKDLAGNPLASNYEWLFTAGPGADTVAPTVVFTSPINGATAAPLKQSVNIAFSENMDPATLNAQTFALKQGTAPVDGKVTAAASTASFAPARKLEKGKDYTATVTTGAKDLAGNKLANDYNWKFTAYSEPKVVGILVTLQNSHFDFDSAEISENGKTILKSNIAALKSKPDMQLRIAGHTSASGSEEYNQSLSERRAEAVKAYIVKEGGIDADRLSTIGYGKKNPAQHEVDPSDKLSPAALANMRVVLEIIEEQ
jgi:outer membrane beta-barrel protein